MEGIHALAAVANDQVKVGGRTDKAGKLVVVELAVGVGKEDPVFSAGLEASLDGGAVASIF